MGGVRRHVSRRRGAETIEAALTLPLVLLVIFGGMEYGWMILRSSQMHAAARVGAREASLSGSSAESVDSVVRSTLMASGIDSFSIEFDPSAPENAEPGTTIKVSVSSGYSGMSLIGLDKIMPLPESLSGSSVMLKED